MIEELKITILNRVISELFQEADKLIKEGLKLSSKNQKMVTVGLSLSVIGLMHACIAPGAAIAFDVVTLFITGGAIAATDLGILKKETEKVKGFIEYFNIEKENICHVLKEELTSELRVDTYFSQEQINKIIDNGILNLSADEIDLFSKIQFNDEQEKYLKTLISNNEKINIINILDLTMIEGTIKNKRFVDLGGKNKTLKDIVLPTKTVKLMKV